MKLNIIAPVIWLSAFLCSLYLVNSWQVELFGGAIILISLWAVSMVTQASATGLTLPRSWCLRIMGAFWLVSFLSILHSEVVNVSVMAFCFFSVMPLGFFVFTLNGNDQQYKIIVRALAVIFALLALWAIIQFFMFSELFRGRATHPLKNPNSLAALFSLAFFCGLGSIFYFKEKSHKYLATLFTALVFAGIMATGSRGALFAMLPMILFFLFIQRKDLSAHKSYLGFLLALCATAFLMTSIGGIDRENLVNRVASTVTMQERDISNNRFLLWQASLGILKDHGILGTGIGTYFLYFPEYRLPQDMAGAYYAHNDPLQFWVELGILGPVLFYAFIIALTLRTAQAWRKAEYNKQQLKVITPYVALGACIIHTHITFNLYNLSILFAIGLLLGFWFQATQKVLQTPVKIFHFPASFTFASRLVAIALPFIVIGGFFSAYLVSEIYTNKARDHLLAGELEPFANNIIAANKISMQGNYRSYLLAVNMPLALLEKGKDKLPEEQQKEIFEQALRYLRHIQKINPRSSSAFYYLGKIQQLVPKNFIPEDMLLPQKYYEEALKIDPVHIGARIELSQIYEKDLLSRDRALEIIEQGAKYRYATPTAIDLYGRLAELYFIDGQSEKGQQTLLKMQRFQRFMDKRTKVADEGLKIDF